MRAFVKRFMLWMNEICKANEALVKSFNLLNTISLIGAVIFVILVTLFLGSNRLVLISFVLPLSGFAAAYYLNSIKRYGPGLFIVFWVSLIHGSIVVYSYEQQFLELIFVSVAIVPLIPFDNLKSVRFMYLTGLVSFNLGGFHLKNYSFFDIHDWPISMLIYFMLMNIVLVAVYQFLITYKKNSLTDRAAIIAKNKEIEEQNDLIKLNTKMIIQFEKEKHILELENKQKDVEVLNINNQLKIKMKGDLILDLQKVKKNKGNNGSDIQMIINKLRNQIEEEKKIDLFQNSIKIVGSDFNNRIKNEFAGLSKSDIELLSLIKLKLSNKQIAIQRNTSPGTINVALHRLKSKCNFNSTADLKGFVEKF